MIIIGIADAIQKIVQFLEKVGRISTIYKIQESGRKRHADENAVGNTG